MKKQNKFFVVGNWKLNPEKEKEALSIFFAVKKSLKSVKNTKVVMCPPAVYLSAFGKYKKTKNLYLGAQDCFWENKGSFTGEVSPKMLYSLKSSFVILGHSERRAFGESSEDVSLKVGAALNAGLWPIVCIGENERDTEGEYLEFLKEEINDSLNFVKDKDLNKIIIAYEPIWAIGKEEAINGHDLHQMEIFIRKILAYRFGRNRSFSVPIIYGGSVTPDNIEDIIINGNVRGVLVGRQSLEPKSFKEIISFVENYAR